MTSFMRFRPLAKESSTGLASEMSRSMVDISSQESIDGPPRMRASTANLFRTSMVSIHAGLQKARALSSFRRRNTRIITTLVLAFGFFFSYLFWSPIPDYKVHISRMLTANRNIAQGVHAVDLTHPWSRALKPFVTRGVFDLKGGFSRTIRGVPVNSTVNYGIVAYGPTGQRREIRVGQITLSTSDEVEIQKTWDVETRLRGVGFPLASLSLEIETNSPAPVGFQLEVLQMPNTARWRPLISGMLLVAIYGLMLTDIINRMLVVLIGSFAMQAVLTAYNGPQTVGQMIARMDISTLGLLFGLMILIQILSTTGGLDVLAYYAVIISKGNALVLLMIMSGICCAASGFLPGASAIMVMVPTGLQVCKMLQMDPSPFVVFLALYGNIGGLYTQLGDPKNLILANNIASIRFADFFSATLPGMLLSVLAGFIFMYFRYRKTMWGARELDLEQLRSMGVVKRKETLIKTGIAFGTVLALMFLTPLHAKDLAWVAVIGAVLVLVVVSPHGIYDVISKIEWEALVYQAGLFVLIAQVDELGVIKVMGNVLNYIIRKAPPKDQMLVAVTIFVWASALLCSFLDNTAFTLTMVKVINFMIADGLQVPIKALAWSLLFGATLGGNFTVVGSASNVVAVTMAGQRGLKMSMIEFSKIAAPMTIVNLIAAYVYCVVAFVEGKFAI